MKFQQLVLSAFPLSTILPSFSQVKWNEVAPGVWKAIIGKSEAWKDCLNLKIP
jgi:hypothetical protein